MTRRDPTRPAAAPSRFEAPLAGESWEVQRALRQLERRVVGFNVRDFGAVADGAADDTPALERALAAAKAASGEAFPVIHIAGRCRITRPLLIDFHCRLTGAAAGAAYGYNGAAPPATGANGDDPRYGSALVWDAASGDLLTITPPGAVNRIYVQLEHLALRGNRYRAGAAGGRGLYAWASSVTSAVQLTLRQVHVTEFYGDNIVLDGNVFESRLDEVHTTLAGGRGLVARNTFPGSVCGELALAGVSAFNCAGRGVEVDVAGSVNLWRVSATGNGAEGIALVNGLVRALGLQAEVNTGPDQLLVGPAAGLMFFPTLVGIVLNYGAVAGLTGVRVRNVVGAVLDGLFAGPATTGKDYVIEASCQRCEVRNYINTSFADNFTNLDPYAWNHRGTEHFGAAARIDYAAGWTGALQKWLVNGVEQCSIINGGGFQFGTGGPVIFTLAGSPEGAVAAPVGSLALRTDGAAGTTLYVKESGTGTTGWVAK